MAQLPVPNVSGIAAVVNENGVEKASPIIHLHPGSPHHPGSPRHVAAGVHGSVPVQIVPDVSPQLAGTIALVSIQFTSGVGPIYQNTWPYPTTADDTGNVGAPYPAVQWQRSQANGTVVSNAPIVQPVMGSSRFMQAVVGLYLPGVSNGTSFRLDGTSSVSYLNLGVQGKLSINPHTKMAYVSIRGNDPLPASLGWTSATIKWTMVLNPNTPHSKYVQLGTTGPHTVYLTYGTPAFDNDPLMHPSNLLTDARLQVAETWASIAVNEAGGIKANPQAIVQQLWNDINTQIGFNVNNTLAVSGHTFWQAPDYIGYGLDCISLETFTCWVAQAVGLPGTFSVVTYVPNLFVGTPAQWDQADRWDQAVQGAFENAQQVPLGANPNYFQPVYYNGDPNKRLFLFDGDNNPNCFEATLVYSPDQNQNHTQIYAGGVNDIYNEIKGDKHNINTIFHDLFRGVGYYNPDGSIAWVHQYS
jgi:hypothetical protein